MTSRVTVDDVATVLLTYRLSGTRQSEDGKYHYSLAFYHPEGGRDRVIEQMDSLGLDKENRRAATVYTGNGFELRVEMRHSPLVSFRRSLHAEPIVLLLTEQHHDIYDRLGTTKCHSHKA